MNIAIIDDNEIDLLLMEEIISRQVVGASVQLFNSIQQTAVDSMLANSEEIDLVVCDVEMPHKSGLDVLKAFRKRHPTTPFLFVSGHTGLDLVMKCKKYGATGYIAKPFTSTTLVNKIERYKNDPFQLGY